MTDIDALSRLRYEEGVDPLDHAVFLVALDLEIRDLARTGQIHPEVPVMLLDQSDEAYARRIVARLLDAGWTPPSFAAGREAQP